MGPFLGVDCLILFGWLIIKSLVTSTIISEMFSYGVSLKQSLWKNYRFNKVLGLIPSKMTLDLDR